MKVAQITRRQAFRWQPDDVRKDPWLRCGTRRGLCLRVTIEGRRQFYFCYTWAKRSRYRLIGDVEEFGLEKAAEEVLRMRRLVRQAKLRGEADPIKAAARRYLQGDEPKTLETLCREYRRRVSKSEKTDKEEARYWGKLIEIELDDGGKLGDRIVARITTADIWQVRAAMSSTPVSFNRARALLSHAMNLAAQWEGYIEDPGRWTNPVTAVPTYPERRRERILTSAEYAAFRRALDQLIDEALTGKGRRRHRLARARSLIGLRIMSRTGIRPVEMRLLERSTVFWDRSFADTRKAKGDRGGEQGRILAFGPQSMADLQQLDELVPAESSVFLPAWADPTRPMDKAGFRKGWRATLQLADELAELGLEADRQVVPYCLRHTIINSHSDAGVDYADMVDFAGHETRRRQGTTHIYRHSESGRLVRTAARLESYWSRTLQADCASRI